MEENETSLDSPPRVPQNNHKCPACHLGEEPGDSHEGIVWYGCDVCPRWWHRHCLSTGDQATADMSCMVADVLFRCPLCPISKICSVCLVEGTTGYIQCSNCSHFYHEDCLPKDLLTEYKVLTELNQKWACSRCYVED